MNRARHVAILTGLVLVTGAVTTAHSWKPGPTAPAGLSARSTRLAFDAVRGKVVLFGGDDGTMHNDTWEYDGTAWTQGPAAPPALTPRSAQAMDFDLSIGKVVLFGGNDGAPRDDTWIYNGTAWTAGPTAPGAMLARTESAMAFDLSLGRSVLFGGDASTTGTQLLNDTWEFDGSAWTPGGTAPAALTKRTAVALAYDMEHRRVVLFGGFDGALLNDTWFYDGAWTQGPAAPAGLTGRSGSGMTYEATPNRIVLFGGFDGAYVNETWEFDGASWSPSITTPTNLEPRFFPGTTYDSARGVTIVYGGFDGSTPYFRDTWEYTVPAHYLVGQGLDIPNPNEVKAFESDGSVALIDFLAYGAGAWGVNVAAGNLDSGSDDEMLTGPGPGAVFGPQVRGFRFDATPLAKINFFAYGTLRYGTNVEPAYLDADDYSEMTTGPGPGVVFGPHIRGFNYDGVAVAAISKVSFFAYGTLKYGANVDAGEMDGDGYEELLTGPGPGLIFGPQVRGFNYDATTVSSIAKINFNAFTTPQYGVNLTAGYLDLDGYTELGCAPGPGAALPSHFLGYNYDNSAIALLPGCDVQPFSTNYGGRVGVGGISSLVKADLIVAPGRDPAAPASVEGYVYTGSNLNPIPGSFTAFTTMYGANVSSMQCPE